MGKENTMLRIFDIKDRCTGCGACASICPKSALTIDYNDEGFYYPHLNQSLCIDCKSCEKVCHVLNLEIPKKPSRQYSAYMCKSQNKDLVSKSSSGGIFSTLAEHVLELGGAVYGARYNFDSEKLEHCSSDSCSLGELRKSKYIESFTGVIFRNVGNDLRNGRTVLFCGTPCQLAGLSSYIQMKKIPSDNLIRVRFICHGVPSNKFFTEYKHFEEKRYGAKMLRFDFRPKNKGWASSDWLMEFANGKSNRGNYTHYSYYYYYYYFQLNYLLRESCYKCNHLKHEMADFTLADFWGIVFYKPELNEQEGLSLVLTHTQRAKEMMGVIRGTCEVEQLPLTATDYIYKDAPERAALLENRNEMMNRVIHDGYMKVAKDTLKGRILKNKLHSVLRNLIGK